MSLPEPQCSHIREGGTLGRQGRYSWLFQSDKEIAPQRTCVLSFVSPSSFSPPTSATSTVGKWQNIIASWEVTWEVKFSEIQVQDGGPSNGHPTERVEGVRAQKMWSGISCAPLTSLPALTCSCDMWEGPRRPFLHRVGLSIPCLHRLAAEWWRAVETASCLRSPLRWSNVLNLYTLHW